MSENFVEPSHANLMQSLLGQFNFEIQSSLCPGPRHVRTDGRQEFLSRVSDCNRPPRIVKAYFSKVSNMASMQIQSEHVSKILFSSLISERISYRLRSVQMRFQGVEIYRVKGMLK